MVLQPFTKLFNAPNADPNRAPPIDSTLVTYDCFHFSQKGHALGKKYINSKRNVNFYCSTFAVLSCCFKYFYLSNILTLC